MISTLIYASSFFNFTFLFFAIGFVVALVIEQFVKPTGNGRDIMIVETNRKYCWRQAWIANLLWFLCNIGLYFASRNVQAPVDTFWNGI